MVGWPSGPRRQFKALVSSEAWVRIPLQSILHIDLGLKSKVIYIGPYVAQMGCVTSQQYQFGLVTY